MRSMTKLIASAACAVALGAFSVANAATVSFSNIVGSWDSIDPASIVASGNGTDNPSMSWGTPATNAGQSGYEYQAAADFSVPVPPGQQVNLGTFSHLNNPIQGTSLDSATLTVSIDIAVDAINQGTFDFVFDFTHDETTNNANPCANGEANNQGVNINGCADLVTVTDNSLSQDFLVDGVLYTISIVGFQVGGSVVTTFETIEQLTNNADLIAVITAAEIPVPGALILMLSGVMGLGFASRKKKAA